MKDDVVTLPFARLAAGVDQRGVLPVQCGAASVGIGGVFERI